MIVKKLLTGITLSLLFVACKHEEIKPLNSGNQPSNEEEISFTQKVQPVINVNCISCHDDNSPVKLYNYGSVKEMAESGQLAGCLTGDTNYMQMPVDPASAQIILDWVRQGMMDN